MNNRKIVRSNWENGINYENGHEFDGYFGDDIGLQVRNHSDDDEYTEEGWQMYQICDILAA